MSFRAREREQQLRWKASTAALSDAARAPGLYTGAARGAHAPERDAMFLHEAHADENLLPNHRDEALTIFRAHGVDWYDGAHDGHRPSNYLLDSMVSCVNCLMPFAHDGRALAALLRPLVPGAVDAVPIEEDRVIAFEWIGLANYLDEGPKRRRGAWGTSLDAHAILTLASGERVGVLVEWKYTEAYTGEEKRGARRYEPMWLATDSPFAVDERTVAALGREPLYQLARAQLLAARMEAARENGATRVVLVVIVPEENDDYRALPKELQDIVGSRDLATGFRSLLKQPDRFALASFASLVISDELRSVCGTDVVARYVDGRAP